MAITLDGTNGINSSGVIVAPDGSASAPSITNDGDTNTGIFFPAADTIAFAEGGAEAMRIDSSGNVGIGTTSPGARLQVNASTTTLKTYGSSFNEQVYDAVAGAFSQAVWQVGAAGKALIGANSTNMLVNTAGDASANIIFATGSGTTERARITSGGEFYVAGTTDQGAYNIQCNGTGVWGAGAYVNGSDERIKDDITPIKSGLDVVEKLNPVTYRYKESWSKDQSTQTGFIAQELLVALEDQNYVDGVVQQGGSEGYYSVAYQNIIPILTKAIQELKAINDAQASRIETLEAKVAALEAGNV